MSDLSTSTAVVAFARAAEAFQLLVEEKRRFATRDDLVRLTKSIAELFGTRADGNSTQMRRLNHETPKDASAEPDGQSQELRR